MSNVISSTNKFQDQVKDIAGDINAVGDGIEVAAQELTEVANALKPCFKACGGLLRSCCANEEKEVIQVQNIKPVVPQANKVVEKSLDARKVE